MDLLASIRNRVYPAACDAARGWLIVSSCLLAGLSVQLATASFVTPISITQTEENESETERTEADVCRRTRHATPVSPDASCLPAARPVRHNADGRPCASRYLCRSPFRAVELIGAGICMRC